ncbi:MAG: AbrB/MazE/SpoVT family DNA-binding domain-containing protein [Acidimicrobiales bacterium]|nr:AbrB/MazE/SpoVT family DNA-binding domain-containing protein [Acidimicrobiales bacterium]HRW36886.1 AbrB/MazE/SpoVT family DNA-binding domain-containing protein [Aquihabitans sp.]
MDATSTAKVSSRGQTNVPALLRRRWGLMDGGELGVIDLGGAALIVPGGEAAARRELRRVLADRYETAVLELDLPELADQ